MENADVDACFRSLCKQFFSTSRVIHLENSSFAAKRQVLQQKLFLGTQDA